MPDYSIDVVLIEYDEMWSAQCLQFDIGAQAKSLQDVVYELNRSLLGHILISREMGVEPFSTLSEAPARYRMLWTGSKVTIQMSDGEDFDVPEYLPHYQARAVSHKSAAL